jgi:hypothetical protein
MRAIENADREVEKGNLWRAREILQGSIPNAGYNCDLFERLGTVFLEMGDLPEAGRFLFLSDRRKPEYEQAIEIFLGKYGKNWRDLFRRFPRAARLSKLSDYPEGVRSKLAQLGFPKVLKEGSVPVTSEPMGVKSSIVVWLIIGSILSVMVLGIIKVVEIVRRIF